MISVKSFDPSLAFVSTDSKRSNSEAEGEIADNVTMSFLVAYLYMSTKYMKEDTMILVAKKYYPVMKKLFGNSESIIKEDQEDAKIYALSFIEHSQNIKDGEVMMPMYMSLRNTKIFNIHSTDEDIIKSDSDHVKKCINFFNCFVRSGKGGLTNIMWSDPISSGTKLQMFNYDQMFVLYVADKYLNRIDPSYQTDSLEEKLAKSLSFLDLLKTEAEELDSSGKLVIRDIASNNGKYLKDAVKAWSFDNIPHAGKLETKSKLIVNVSLSYKAALISFLSACNVKKKDRVTIVLYGQFQDYSFVNDLSSSMYTNAKFMVWVEETTKIKTSKNIEKLTGKFSANELGEKCYLFSVAKVNDVTLKKFADNVNCESRSLVYVGTTNYIPEKLIMPVYSDATAHVYSVINPCELKKMSSDEKSLLINSADTYYKEFNSSYRNVNKWMYNVSVPGKTVKLTSKPVSYDEAYLMSLNL